MIYLTFELVGDVLQIKEILKTKPKIAKDEYIVLTEEIWNDIEKNELHIELINFSSMILPIPPYKVKLWVMFEDVPYNAVDLFDIKRNYNDKLIEEMFDYS